MIGFIFGLLAALLLVMFSVRLLAGGWVLLALAVAAEWAKAHGCTAIHL